MEKHELTALCLALEDSLMDTPFTSGENTVIRHKGNKKWFALIFELDGRLCVNLKCEPLKAEFWRKAYASVIPAWHMNKTHWNTVFLNGEIPSRDLREMIADSYYLTCGKQRRV